MQFLRPDGRGQLGPGETISSAAIICTKKSDGTDTTAEMISSPAPFRDTEVRYILKGGVKKSKYLLEFRVVTSLGNKLSETLEVTII